MDKHEDTSDFKEYADGWITERKHTAIPTFLKFAYIVIVAGCVTYALLYRNGETTHASRGPLVQYFNSISLPADGFMYFVAGLVVVFGLVLVRFAFRGTGE